MKAIIKKPLVVTTIICLVLNILVELYESQYLSYSSHYLRILSDGFFVSGIAILIVAVLCFISNEGGLYFMGYLRVRLKYTIAKQGKPIPYYQYVQDKQSEKKFNLSHMFIVSITSILISLLLAFI